MHEAELGPVLAPTGPQTRGNFGDSKNVSDVPRAIATQGATCFFRLSGFSRRFTKRPAATGGKYV